VTQDELASLYTQYGFFLKRRCCVILRDASAADDALQDVFVKVMHSDQSLASIEQPLAWLYRIVHRVCLDALRRKRVRKAEDLDSAQPELDRNTSLYGACGRMRLGHALFRDAGA
jgi:RNA polymerase sigma factor (sigma-70 family)